MKASRAIASTLALTIGAALRSMRERAGLTRKQLAIRIHSHRPIIGRIERGLHVPELCTVNAYVAACGGDVREVTLAIDRELGMGRAA